MLSKLFATKVLKTSLIGLYIERSSILVVKCLLMPGSQSASPIIRNEMKGDRRPQRAIVAFGGRRWDVSNLCSTGPAPTAQRNRKERQRVRPRRKQQWIPLYPSIEELPPVPSAATLFAPYSHNVGNMSYEEEHRAWPQRPEPLLERRAPGPETDPVWSPSPGLERLRGHGPEPEPEPVPQEDEPTFERRMVEVAPGHFVALRGSEETWHALQRNTVTIVSCSCCEISLQCIQDAAMVLCPDCKMISPLADNGDGLGLGIKLDGLADVPAESEHVHVPTFEDTKKAAAPPIDYSAVKKPERKPAPIDYSRVHTRDVRKKGRQRIDYRRVERGRERHSEERVSRVDYQAFSMPRYIPGGE